jgi:predicted ABC-type ATPase
LFFWLYSADLAVSRVKHRVKEGGHNIPEDIIRRRYKSGLQNFFKLYLPIVDNWLFVNNSGDTYEIIAEGSVEETIINNELLWGKVKEKYYDN